MRAKLLNQLIKQEQDTELKRKDRHWYTVFISTYITDLDIQVSADEAEKRIYELCNRYFESEDCHCYDFTFERNGMLGFWQFSFRTSTEITKFDINENPEEEQELLLAFAQDWYDKEGYKDYPEMEITEVEPLDPRNDRIKIHLTGTFGSTEVVFARNQRRKE